jgi:putative membrane protein
MDTTDFGFWAMIIFWGTAIGGIATAITWARMKGRNPVDRELLVKSLQRRLEAGEISQDEYDRKLAELPRDGD